MTNRTTTIRHEKLLKQYDRVNLLLLGQSNREYINELKRMRQATVEELKKEQRALGLIK